MKFEQENILPTSKSYIANGQINPDCNLLPTLVHDISIQSEWCDFRTFLIHVYHYYA